jgi:hypothetical protein
MQSEARRLKNIELQKNLTSDSANSRLLKFFEILMKIDKRENIVCDTRESKDKELKINCENQ